MQRRGIRMVSLNVNGMNNPIKRGKVLTKFRKEEVQVIYFQDIPRGARLTIDRGRAESILQLRYYGGRGGESN